MPKKPKPVFRLQFRQSDQLVELYAHGVSQSSMLGFIEVSELIFDSKTEILIDPAEEKLKAAFEGVTCTYLPMHSIIRIDEVERQGINKIRPLNKSEKSSATVANFPFTSIPSE